MITLMRVPAPYFFTLAKILLDRKGTQDPFGSLYDSRHCEIRGSAERTTLVVRCKDIDPSNPGGIAASRGPDGEAFTGLHTRIASHMEQQASQCFPGEHVFDFEVSGKDGQAGTRRIAGLGLIDAKRWLARAEPGLEILDVPAIRTLGEFAAEMPVGTPFEMTDNLVSERAWKARSAAAEACPHDVHLITWRYHGDKGENRIHEAEPVLALDIADAVSFSRACQAPSHVARIVRIDVLTMPEYMAAKGKQAREPVVAPGLAAFDRLTQAVPGRDAGTERS